MTAGITAVVLSVAAGAAARAWRAARARRYVLARLGVRGSSATDRRIAVVLVVGAGALALLGPFVGIVVVAGGLVAPAVIARWRAAAAEAGEADALPDVVDELARALRAGAPPRSALRDAARSAPPRLGDALGGAASAADRGVPLVAALDHWAAASALEGADLVATAVAVTASSGGDPARALTSVGDTLRDRRSLRREVRALSSQARMSALVIAVAPLAFAVVLAGTDGTTAAFLLRSPIGVACLALGLALDVAGWWWMDRITRSLR